MNKKIKAVANKCKNCGYDLVFNPDSNSVVCPSCKSSTPILQNKIIAKHDFERSYKTADKNTEWGNQNKSMECPNCGARVALMQFQAAANCPYCNSELVASMEQFSGLKPDAIIPFKISKEKAVEKFKNILKSKFLVPKSFKNSVSADEIHGYYFPVFMFEADCITQYSGRLYEEYTVKDREGNSETRRRYFNIQGTLPSRHNNIEVEASSKLSQYELAGISPYDHKLAQAYNDEYVYGYELEFYSNSVEASYEQALKIMKAQIRQSILFKYHYDGVDHLDMSHSFSNPKYTYSMLPMYRINYTYKNKKYTNIMNGQSGKLTGSYPKSGAKITLLVLAGVLVFLVPVILILLFVFM